MERREFLLAAAAQAALVPGVRLIAHRGGVVEGGRAENSAAAMEEALRRGYWMLEIDLRVTRDGRVVLHHDANLEKRFGDSRRAEDLTLAECRGLRGGQGDRLLTLDEACEIAAGRGRFMLDAKGEPWPEDAGALVRRTLRSARLLAPCWVLGGEGLKGHLRDEAEHAIGRDELQRLLDNGEPVHRLYLFELGSRMNEESVAMARSVRIPAVAAINAFRYKAARVSEEEGARADVQRLRSLGVTDFQVDSRYERLFV